MKNFEQIGTEIGELVEVKNAAYGSSFAKAGDYLRLLYPDGIAPEQYTDALLLVRDFDKSMRIATDRDALGENPWADKVGYGILGVHLHQTKEETGPCKTTRESASDLSAGNSSREQHGSARAESASAPTTTPASAPAASAPSPQPDGCSNELESAPAATAMEAASASADENPNRCALCDEQHPCAGTGHVVFQPVGELDMERDYVLVRRRA